MKGGNQEWDSDGAVWVLERDMALFFVYLRQVTTAVEKH